jgi:hypothetical protein
LSKKKLIFIAEELFLSRKMKIFFILPLLLISTTLSAQKLKPATEVIIDPKTRLPDKLSPFDEYFIINIPIDSANKKEDIRSVFIYRAQRHKLPRDSNEIKINLRNNFPHSVRKVIYQPYVKCGENNAYGTEMSVLEVEKKTDYSNIRALVPPLIYNENYLITIRYQMPVEWKEKLEEVNDLLVLNTTAATNSAQSLYLEVLNYVREFSAEHDYRLSVPSETLDLAAYKTKFDSEVNSKFQQLRTGLDDNNTRIAELYNVLFDCIKTCVNCQCLTECGCDEKPMFENIANYSAAFLTTHCCVDNFFTSDRIGYLSSGRASLIDFGNPPAVDAQQATLLSGARMKKLQSSIDFLNALRKLYLGTAFSKHLDCDCKKTLLESVENLQAALKEKQKALKPLLKAYQDAMDILIYNNDFDLLKVTDLNSNVADIKTLSGNFIIPEFGLAGMFPTANADPGLIVRPYYGINISFRPINKNIRFRDIPDRYWRNLWYRTSLTLGLTYWALNKNRSDIKDLLDDTSPLLGLNYRCSRAFRIGGGFIMYHQHSTNPLLKDIRTVMPYVSLSIDVDVVSFASKLTDRIFK